MPTQLHPVARPVNTMIAPNVAPPPRGNPTGDLAQALSGLSSTMGQIADREAGVEIQRQKQAGAAQYAQDIANGRFANLDAFKDAVNKGLIKDSDNPYFIEQYRANMSTYLMQQQLNSAVDTYHQDPIQKEEDANKVRKWFTDRLAPSMKDLDTVSAAAVGPEMSSAIDQLVGRHIENISVERQQKNEDLFAAGIHQSLTQLTPGVLALAKSGDVQAKGVISSVIKQIKADADNHRKTMNDERVGKLTAATVLAYADQIKDSSFVEEALDQLDNIPGQKLKDDPDTMARAGNLSLRVLQEKAAEAETKERLHEVKSRQTVRDFKQQLLDAREKNVPWPDMLKQQQFVAPFKQLDPEGQLEIQSFVDKHNEDEVLGDMAKMAADYQRTGQLPQNAEAAMTLRAISTRNPRFIQEYASTIKEMKSGLTAASNRDAKAEWEHNIAIGKVSSASFQDATKPDNISWADWHTMQAQVADKEQNIAHTSATNLINNKINHIETMVSRAIEQGELPSMSRMEGLPFERSNIGAKVSLAAATFRANVFDKNIAEYTKGGGLDGEKFDKDLTAYINQALASSPELQEKGLISYDRLDAKFSGQPGADQQSPQAVKTPPRQATQEEQKVLGVNGVVTPGKTVSDPLLTAGISVLKNSKVRLAPEDQNTVDVWNKYKIDARGIAFRPGFLGIGADYDPSPKSGRLMMDGLPAKDGSVQVPFANVTRSILDQRSPEQMAQEVINTFDDPIAVLRRYQAVYNDPLTPTPVDIQGNLMAPHGSSYSRDVVNPLAGGVSASDTEINAWEQKTGRDVGKDAEVQGSRFEMALRDQIWEKYKSDRDTLQHLDTQYGKDIRDLNNPTSKVRVTPQLKLAAAQMSHLMRELNYTQAAVGLPWKEQAESDPQAWKTTPLFVNQTDLDQNGLKALKAFNVPASERPKAIEYQTYATMAKRYGMRIPSYDEYFSKHGSKSGSGN